MSYYIEQLPQFCEPLSVKFSQCAKTIIFQTDTPNEALTLVFTTFQGKEYIYETISDNNGIVQVDLSEFPEGLFNPYVGYFDLKAFVSGLGNARRVLFINDYGKYPALSIKVVVANYVNTTLPEPFVIDTVEYVCCCSAVCYINRCETIEPEPGEEKP